MVHLHYLVKCEIDCSRLFPNLTTMFLSKRYESFVAANSRHQDDQRHGVPRRNGLAKTAYYSGEFRRTQRGDQSVMGLTCNPDAYGRALQSQCEVRSDVNSMPNYRRPAANRFKVIVLFVVSCQEEN